VVYKKQEGVKENKELNNDAREAAGDRGRLKHRS
jgi:hypothetical protein